MLNGIIRRILSAIPTLLVGITLCFLIIHLAPGNPATRFLNPSQTAATQEIIRERFGLNQSLPIQYFHWLKQVLFHFDFGYSFYNGKDCTEVLISALGPTIILSFWALVFALSVGISLGIFTALRADTHVDRVINSTMMIFLSTPAFWLGLMFIGLFTIHLNWLPGSHLHSLYYDQLDSFGQLLDSVRHLILPVFTLGLPLAATVFKYIRAGMIDALQSDYTLAARARGIRQSTILWKYSLKNSLLPLVSLLGVIIPALLSGAVIVEVVFALPGVGRAMVTAVFGRDYPILMAGASLAFFIVILFNIVADIFYRILDPRIRNSAGGL
ncbi:MAG: ABC transporter permease [Candidatus Marinimicrobia bacterium]|nr:ABC transporter permease [Candidatus Neomarinimicrobiota bacterium]